MTCLKHTKSSLMEQGVGLGEVGCEPEDGAGWERHGEVLRAVISGCMPCSLSQGLRCSRCLASFPTSGAAGLEGLGQDSGTKTEPGTQGGPWDRKGTGCVSGVRQA